MGPLFLTLDEVLSLHAEQIRLFDSDLSRSKPVTYEQWKRRPMHERVFEQVLTLFGYFL